MDTRIYVMTHKEIAEISDEIYIPLQVGRAGKQALGYIGDDTGDQISEKNLFYCELTGIYWLWKNVKCDIIGICHYRRYFTRQEKLLDKDYIEKTIQKYPIMIPNSSCVNEADAFCHYAKRHNGKDLELCREIIQKKYPEYSAAFEYAMKSVLVSTCNMWITRKDIFDRYCSWLFDILFEAEKEIPFWNYDDYQKRVMGFLAERLFRVWLFLQPEAITEEHMKLMDPSELNHAKKRADLLYQCVKMKMKPLLGLYQTDAVEGSFVQPFDCRDDFGGKIPVWVCWWQGEKEMPEFISGCIRSIRMHLPEDITVLKLITLENCMQYVTFTEKVIQRFNEGNITYAQLADLLQAELLYRYGGMWVDAACFVTKPIEKNVFEQQIYTLRFQASFCEADITKGRWCKKVWYTRKGYQLFRFLTESLWYYWEIEDKMIDYDLVDPIIAVAVDEFSDIRKDLEKCEYVENTMFLKHQWMNQKYSPERLRILAEKGTFYKLNMQEVYRKELITGEQTMYGCLFKESNDYYSRKNQ